MRLHQIKSSIIPDWILCEVKGIYQHLLNGVQAGITEIFRFTTDGRSDTVIESDHHADASGPHIHVSMGYRRNQLACFDATWQNNKLGGVPFANTLYQFDSKEILIRRTLGGHNFHERLPKPERFVALPLLHIFTGKAVREAYSLSRGGQVNSKYKRSQ